MESNQNQNYMTLNLFKQLINKGVDITQYLLLQYLNLNLDLKDVDVKLMGKLLVMEKQRLISRLGDMWVVTPKGKQLLEIEEQPQTITIQQDWVEQLYQDIEAVIVKNTGKKQYLNGSGKYLKPANPQMLKDRFQAFFKKFGNQNIEKIKKAMLSYTNKVTKGEIKYAVTLLYFIFKEGKSQGNYESQLLEWMEIEEDKPEQLQPISTKNLF